MPLSYAESCDRDKCICESHQNYERIAEQRLEESQSLDQQIEQLIEEFKEELDRLQREDREESEEEEEEPPEVIDE